MQFLKLINFCNNVKCLPAKTNKVPKLGQENSFNKNVHTTSFFIYIYIRTILRYYPDNIRVRSVLNRFLNLAFF